MGVLGLAPLALLVAVLVPTLWSASLRLIWRPYAMARAFRKQGLRGPPYRFWTGSVEEIKKITKAARELVLDSHSHDITLRVLPHYRRWIEQYGTTFVFWHGTQPRICISDPEMAKQILSSKMGFFVKPEQNPAMMALLGKGLLFVEGSDWARHRRIANPAFTVDKLKMLAKEMAGRAETMLEGWQVEILQAENQHKEIEVGKAFQEVTADIIARTAFGCSYMEAKEVSLAQQELQVVATESLIRIDFPGYRYLPTKRNQYRWKLERRLSSKLTGIIKERLNSKDYSNANDLLGLMMKANEEPQDSPTMSMDEIIDECKTFFFAGHETTSHLLTWTTFLLSTNPDWQEKLREEVLRECAMDIPNAETVSKLKLVNMVLLETLRLYPPVVVMTRMPTRDIIVENINLPKDTALMIPTSIIHRNKDVWGSDVNEFNPIRFENGISKAAKHPNALLAFSVGPRACIGQNLAMLEAKIVTAMILQRFSFSISPNYKHTPFYLLTLQPEYGLPIIFRPLHS